MRHLVDTWRRLDFHARAANTLTSARSEQIAKAAGIADATKSVRCTTCHAPFHEVPAAAFAKTIPPGVGVSCENCHGPAERWLLSHTRKDLSHADKVAGGLRDLRDLHTRASSCVACHQNVETPLINAGHPELIFELDGQSVTQPRHWIERGNYNGGRAWLVGQAVALREISSQLAKEPANAALAARWSALVWLLQKAAGADESLPTLRAVSAEISTSNAAKAQEAADDLARKAGVSDWTAKTSADAIRLLGAAATDFRDKGQSPLIHARRAERLVLALDRLATALGRKDLDVEINALFSMAQSVPDFDHKRAGEFGATLEQLAKKAGDRAPSR